MNLSHMELCMFQLKSFRAPLHSQSLEDVKAIVKRNISDGVINNGLSLKGQSHWSVHKSPASLCIYLHVVKSYCAQLQVFDCVFYCWQDFCFFTRCLFNGDGTKPLGQFWGHLDTTIIYNSQRSTCHRSKIWIYSNTKHELVCYVCVYFFF